MDSNRRVRQSQNANDVSVRPAGDSFLIVDTSESENPHSRIIIHILRGCEVIQPSVLSRLPPMINDAAVSSRAATAEPARALIPSFISSRCLQDLQSDSKSRKQTAKTSQEGVFSYFANPTLFLRLKSCLTLNVRLQTGVGTGPVSVLALCFRGDLRSSSGAPRLGSVCRDSGTDGRDLN